MRSALAPYWLRVFYRCWNDRFPIGEQLCSAQTQHDVGVAQDSTATLRLFDFFFVPPRIHSAESWGKDERP